MLCYNFMRTIHILGYINMIKAIADWQPDYNKVAFPLKKPSIKPHYNPKQPSIFRCNNLYHFSKAA